MNEKENPGTTSSQHLSLPQAPTTPFARTTIAGMLMGLANLVPGISGGTMIVVMGLYDRFVSSVADASRLALTRSNVTFLAVLATAAIVAIGAGAGTLRDAVTLHRMEMFSLFIGMTLGGIPLLLGMVGTNRKSATIGAIIGLTIMVLIAMNQTERPDRDDIKAAVAAGELVVEPNMARDLIAGVMGMSAMILPGISGAYMLLIIGRYEAILTAISICKTFLTSTGKEGDIAVAAQILIPVAIGALVGLVVLSNALKWLLRQKKDLTIGILLGILCGSVVGIWPFDSDAGTMQYATGAGLSILGFGSTVLLSRVGK